MSTSRQEEIIKKGFIKSLLEGKLELKDLAGINIDLDMARQAYMQGVQEATQALIELVKNNMATSAGQALQATAAKQDLQATAAIQDLIKTAVEGSRNILGCPAFDMTGLDLYLPMDEGSGIIAHDESGNSLDATLTTVTWGTGKFNGGIVFGAAGGKIAISDDPILREIDNITWEIWVNRSELDRTDSLFSKYNVGVASQYYWRIAADNRIWMDIPWVKSNIIVSVGTVGLGDHHLVFTKDGDDYCIYIDGVLDKEETDSAVMVGCVEDLIIGAKTEPADPEPFLGTLDEARIFSRTLSVDEVRLRYIYGEEIKAKERGAEYLLFTEFKDNQGKLYVLTASDTIQLEDLGAESNWGTTYIKKKQFTILTSGVVRVTGEIHASSPYVSYCQIRINDIAVDTWSTGNEAWTPKTSDIAIGSGDLLQLWIKCSGDSDSNLRYARIKCNSELGAPIVGVVS